MPKFLVNHREPIEPANQTDKLREVGSPLTFPKQFCEQELRRAWIRAGRPATELYGLPTEVRDALRHPFTLHAFLDLLQATGCIPPLVLSRPGILEAWLNLRLDAEAVQCEHLARDVYRQALCIFAARLDDSATGWLSVDELKDVPRFDVSRPPGPVIDRLIASNIIQTVPGHAERIRFSFEAVHDYFLAEHEVTQISSDPAKVLEPYRRLNFSQCCTRLAQIGRKTPGVANRNEFVALLTDDDPAKAAVVLRAEPLQFGSEIRSKVVDGLAREISSRFRTQGVFAVELLGTLDCPESRAKLVQVLLPASDCPRHLKLAGGITSARLGLVEGVTLTYELPWFAGWREHGQYYADLLEICRSSTPQFRHALGELAISRLAAGCGTAEHGRAVCVLANVKNEHLIAHLEQRLESAEELFGYENHALIAHGSEAAARLFARSARSIANRMRSISISDGGFERQRVAHTVSHLSGDYQFLVGPEFETCIVGMLDDEDEILSGLGLNMARTARTPHLIHAMARSTRYRVRNAPVIDRLQEAIDPDLWLDWWGSSANDHTRENLIHLTSLIPDPRVEAALIECLEVAELSGYAARRLGEFGGSRAIPKLRAVTKNETGDNSEWSRLQAAWALGMLLDGGAVECLEEASRGPEHLSCFAIVSLGQLGTAESEKSLIRLLHQGVDAAHIASGLIAHGSTTAVAKAVEIAKSQEHGPVWLANCVDTAFAFRSQRRTTYYTHVHLSGLVPYLNTARPNTDQERWALQGAIRRIDGEEIRELLRAWARGNETVSPGAANEGAVSEFARFAQEELGFRSDPSVVEQFIDEMMAEKEPFRVKHVSIEQLRGLPPEAVARGLRSRLEVAMDPVGLTRLVYAIGHLGDPSDAETVRPFMEHENDQLAGIAFESLCRLTDPLRLPRHWHAFDD